MSHRIKVTVEQMHILKNHSSAHQTGNDERDRFYKFPFFKIDGEYIIPLGFEEMSEEAQDCFLQMMGFYVDRSYSKNQRTLIPYKYMQ